MLNPDEANELADPDIVFHKHLHDFQEAFTKEKRAEVKMSWLQKMQTIWDSSSTSYDEPVAQTKTRGRLGIKSKQQNKPDDPTAQPPLQRTYSQKAFET